MRSFLLAAASLAALGAASPPAEAATRALVIGINKYPQITLNGKPSARDLKGAVADAGTMKDTLVSAMGVPEADVKVLTDEAATRDAILAAFREWLIDGTKPGDTAYFYFAGHGAQVEDKDTDEPDKLDEVLAPADTVGELGTKGTGLSGTITDDEIRGLVAELAGREVVVIADACHSGTITRDALAARADEPAGPDGYVPVRTLTPYGPATLSNEAIASVETRGLMRVDARLISVEPDPGPAPATPTAPPKVVTWTAVGSGQFAMEDMEKGGSQGLFTSRFKKGVTEFEADLDENGKVTGSELLAYLRKESSAYCAKFPCPTGATPTLDAYQGYDAAVVAVKAEGVVVPKFEPGPPPPATPVAYPVGPKAPAYTPPPAAYAPPPPPPPAPPPADYVAKKPDYVAPAPTPDYAAPVVVAKGTVPAPIGPAYYGEVTVSLEPGNYVKVGDTIRIAVKSAVPGRLILLDARDDGSVIQLFPNKFSLDFGTSETIKAGETRFLPGKNEVFPFEFKADKADHGTIIALVVDPNVPVKTLVDKYLDLSPIPSVDAYAAEISHEINKAVGYPVGSEEALDTQAFPVPYGRGEFRYEIY